MDKSNIIVYQDNTVLAYSIFETVYSQDKSKDYKLIMSNEVFNLEFENPEKILNNNLSEICTLLQIENKDLITEAFGQALATSNNVNLEINLPRLSCWKRLSIFPIDENKLLCTILDIKKENQEDKELIEKQSEDIVDRAIRDELTGAYNRFHMEKVIENEIKHSRIEGTTFSIIEFDLDDFKKVNDTWGHPMGDETLKDVADVVRSMLRTTDILFRMGGEEFLIILKNTYAKGALAAAEKIRIALEKRRHPVTGVQTCSFGVAAWNSHETFQNCYRRADKALYKAKKTGKNCVVVSDVLIELGDTLDRLIWSENWKCGCKELDLQHQDLIENVKQILIRYFNNTGNSDLEQEIVQIKQEISQHMTREESIMQDIKFPGWQEHKKIHKTLMDELERMEVFYHNGDMRFADLIMFIAEDVLLGHFINMDMKYFSYLK